MFCQQLLAEISEKEIRRGRGSLEDLSEKGTKEVYELIEKFVKNDDASKRSLYYQRIVEAISRDRENSTILQRAGRKPAGEEGQPQADLQP